MNYKKYRISEIEAELKAEFSGKEMHSGMAYTLATQQFVKEEKEKCSSGKYTSIVPNNSCSENTNLIPNEPNIESKFKKEEFVKILKTDVTWKITNLKYDKYYRYIYTLEVIENRIGIKKMNGVPECLLVK
jgi:hypothetical protein